jgi:hypothetical protein
LYEARTPRTLNLSLSTPDGPVSVLDVVDAWLCGKPSPVDLRSAYFSENKHLIFAIVSVAALRIGWWSRAHRFAELAMSAARYLPPGSLMIDGTVGGEVNSIDTHYYRELGYLRALTCRMRIGAQGPNEDVGEDIWAPLLDEAVAVLSACQARHDELGEFHLQLRAISERAAVRGFYSAWLAVLNARAKNRVRSDSRRGYSRQRAIQEYANLLEDLKLSLSFAFEKPEFSTLTANDGLIMQIHANVAAAYAMSQICTDFDPALFSRMLSGPLETYVIEWWKALETNGHLVQVFQQLPQLVQHQVAVFFRDFGGPRTPRDPSRQVPHLQLDIELQPLFVRELQPVAEEG